jgi:hypothetical protein
MSEPCPHYSYTGVDTPGGSKLWRCDTCGRLFADCSACDGTGYAAEEPCTDCFTVGLIPAPDTSSASDTRQPATEEGKR